ncbi:hypothetical protein TOPH_06437 [Tolypocladium ophioglossoides CBS 100239]|uniref:Uncharacterized protein n=1 Tax=Tolypocladium ophioglossoides (strain CBS 100239) TaxID=1163406 RepID=A0A0L0N4F5_TOLOC|nr:hypothetical protein TOPH_06437 [Tolypocladium ophioglossoides CBS 100239]
MAPTYTMSAHLCKQVYASWRQTRHQPSPPPPPPPPQQSSSVPVPVPAPAPAPAPPPAAASRSPSPHAHEDRSLDGQRSRRSSSSSSRDWPLIGDQKPGAPELHPPVKSMGVFDTVDSLGIPGFVGRVDAGEERA